MIECTIFKRNNIKQERNKKPYINVEKNIFNIKNAI